MSDFKLLQLRIISILEGVSFIALLFFAMPMKYLAGEPIYVKYAGMTHGLLFIVFLFALYSAWSEYKWSFRVTLSCFICSLLPFAPFYLEKKLKVINNTDIF